MAKINESKDGTLYGCPECEKICNAVEKNTCQRNKMRQVAALFGKKLGEEFTVKVPQYDEYGEVKQYQNVKGYFCGRGFRSEQINIADTFIFAELLEGYAVIADE